MASIFKINLLKIFYVSQSCGEGEYDDNDRTIKITCKNPFRNN